MWNIRRLIRTLTLLVCIQLINGKTPFNIIRLKTPSDYDYQNILIDWITTHPGVDVMRFNNEEIIVVIPKAHLRSFWKFGISENGTDLLDRKLDNSSLDYNAFRFTENKESSAVRDNGVRELMQREKGHLHINFSERPSYHKITSFLKIFASRFPENIKLTTLGKTAKNQHIYMAIVSAKKTNYKNGVFLHAGVQGREWISVLVVLYLIQEIVENSHSHPGISHLTWYIIPVVNPDGYRHAYRHGKTNVWHNKNRNCLQPCDYGECGVDVFRNFPWKFQERGSSMQPCSPFYAGEKPFSETESKALGQALAENRKYLKMYIGIHGHESAILYPWGYDHTPCNDHKELEQLAKIAANAMKAKSGNFTNYRIGNLGAVTYPSAGSSLDYAKHTLRIKFSYVIHMRGPKNNDDRFPFDLKEVLPLVEETFAGIKAMATTIYNKHLPPKRSLRSIQRKRRLLEPKNIGSKIKIASVLFTWHLITTFVR